MRCAVVIVTAKSMIVCTTLHFTRNILIYNIMDHEEGFLTAVAEARAGAQEGGVPIGACLVSADGKILGRGHNMRAQKGSATLHVSSHLIKDISDISDISFEVHCLKNTGLRDLPNNVPSPCCLTICSVIRLRYPVWKTLGDCRPLRTKAVRCIQLCLPAICARELAFCTKLPASLLASTEIS